MRKVFHYIHYIILISFISITIISCEDFQLGENFLEKKASTDLTIDEVFSSKTYAEQALAEVYRSLPDGLPQNDRMGYLTLDSYTDLGDKRKLGTNPIYSANLNSTTQTISLLYGIDGRGDDRSPWTGIRRGYIFIENVDRVPDMTEQEKKIRKGEAKLIIALHYSQMMRFFGSVPWVNRSFRPDEDFMTERLTIEAMVDSITYLIDEAASVLPWYVDQNDDGRMTKAAALGLKIRVLLFAASPLFNDNEPYASGEATDRRYVWYGNYSRERWEKAFEACQEFINELEKNGFYKLVNTGNPREDFLAGYFNRYNAEVLMSSRWRKTYENGMFSFSQLTYGVCNPTLNLVDMYPMVDGSNFSWENPEHANYPFFKNGEYTRDIRLYETCIVNEDKYLGRKAETYVGGREYNRSNMCKNGFGFRKFIQDQVSSYGKFYQWPLLRLPEVYLSIAEIYNEMGMDSEAYKYIDLVRDRVAMPNITQGLNQTELREAILNERVLELAFEEVRYFDLVRHKRHDIFRACAELKILEIQKTNSGFSYEIKQSPLIRVHAQNWKEHYLLQPFPQEEINKKYGLIQNPGW